MKRSKVFLGFTTCCLAVAALAAKKSSSGTVTTGYYSTPSGCVGTFSPGSSFTLYTSASANVLSYSIAVVPSTTKTLYSQENIGAPCDAINNLPLYVPKAEDGNDPR